MGRGNTLLSCEGKKCLVCEPRERNTDLWAVTGLEPVLHLLRRVQHRVAMHLKRVCYHGLREPQN